MKEFEILEIPLGFELEWNNLDYYGNEDFLFNEFGEFGKVKDDGSLQNGFEIASPIHKGKNFISHNKEYLNARWDNLFSTVRRNNLLEDDNAGMHIHVAHKDLSDEEIKKINLFITHPFNRAFIQKIGGRSFNDYSDPDMNSDREIEIRESVCADRAMTLSNKFPTLEFRFFCSVSSKKKFLKNIEFVLCLIESVKYHEGMSVAEYAYSNYKEYPVLSMGDRSGQRYGAPEVLKDFLSSFGNPKKYPNLYASVV